jgi:DtxR family Mn-dependent transcriptional regulator
MSRTVPHGRRAEDYLKILYMLSKEKKVVRVRDLSKALGVKPSSVVEYLEKLAQEGYVVHKKGEYIELTEKGRSLGEKLYRRYMALMRFLKEILMLPDDVAAEDACYIEHGLHDVTLERIRMFLEFLDLHLKEKGRVNFLEHLREYYLKGELPESCRS